MKNTVTFVSVAIILVSCGSDPSESSGPDSELVCSSSDRSGTYLGTINEISGNCGGSGTFLVNIDSINPQCFLKYDRWSENDCKNERAFWCNDQANGVRFDYTGITKQMDNSGNEIRGTITMIASDLYSGQTLCISTYNVFYERQ